jgi:hypothetical protein
MGHQQLVFESPLQIIKFFPCLRTGMLWCVSINNLLVMCLLTIIILSADRPLVRD